MGAMVKFFEILVIILFTVTMVCTIIATSIPYWSIDKSQPGIQEVQLGLWRICKKTDTSSNCDGFALGNDDCAHTLRVVRGFSVMGIVFSGLTAWVSLVATITGRRFVNAILPLFCSLTCSTTMICWLVFGGYKDDLRCSASDVEFSASFGLQVGAFGVAFIATIITVLLHWSEGGFGMGNAVQANTSRIAVKTLETQVAEDIKAIEAPPPQIAAPPGQLVLSDAAAVP